MLKKKAAAKKIGIFEALVSVFTISFVDRFREIGGWKHGGDAGKIREMIRSESAGNFFYFFQTSTFSLHPHFFFLLNCRIYGR